MPFAGGSLDPGYNSSANSSPFSKNYLGFSYLAEADAGAEGVAAEEVGGGHGAFAGGFGVQ